MAWYICFFAALAVIVLAAVLSVYSLFNKMRENHGVRRIKFLHLMFAVCFILSFLLCIPPLNATYSSKGIGIFKTVIIALQKSVRVFGADGIYENVFEMIGLSPAWMSDAYMIIVLTVQIVAPILTFSFILSFFKNLVGYLRYHFFFWKDAHVFTELNSKTVALARNILDNDRKRNNGKKSGVWRDLIYHLTSRPLIVFTDVTMRNEEVHFDLMNAAEKMGAIVFSRDPESISFIRKRGKSALSFYIISENNSEKLHHAINIMHEYDRDNVSLYVFSEDCCAQFFFAAKAVEKMKVIRVNDIQSLIYHSLDKYGFRMFKKAHECNNNVISAVVIGLGRYGTEMTKALLWYCQIVGFSLKLNVFEQNAHALENFEALCPEIIQKNNEQIDGEAKYDITIHSGVDISGMNFIKKLEEIKDATYIFVCVGSDDMNIATAVNLRTLYERINPSFKPDIETVVYDTAISKVMGIQWPDDIEAQDVCDDRELTGIKNYKEQAYRIHIIGDLESFYTEETVIDARLVDMGLQVHMRWSGDDAEEQKKFWKYEYNYRSSISKAMHERLRQNLIKLGYMEEIPGVGKEWESLNEEERLEIGRVEHIRWNAYIRTEGYRCGDRNDLAKQHDRLVPVTELDDDDLRKDA